MIYNYVTLEPKPDSFDSRMLEEMSWHHKLFELLREVHKVRAFQIEMHPSPWHRSLEDSILVLRKIVAAEKARGGFDDFFPEPLVTLATHRRFS